jgi:hyperosmotically inducible protein
VAKVANLTRCAGRGERGLTPAASGRGGDLVESPPAAAPRVKTSATSSRAPHLVDVTKKHARTLLRGVAVEERNSMTKILVTISVLMFSWALAAEEVSTFSAYVDSDICSRLMLGPITEPRMECSKSTVKDGNEPVLVRLGNNMVFTVNKTKMIKDNVGQLAEVTGEAKVKNGTMKLQGVKPITAEAIPQGDPGRKLLVVRTYKAGGDAKLHEKVRHELAMMPYISEFDFISFTLNGGEVILTGWTVRITNRSTAFNIVKSIEGVESVVNNIDVLPLGSLDMQVRAGARAALQRHLSRYFWGSGSDIKIVVKNGQIILLGTVASKMDFDIATIQCNSVPNAFHVFNLLRIQSGEKKKAS